MHSFVKAHSCLFGQTQKEIQPISGSVHAQHNSDPTPTTGLKQPHQYHISTVGAADRAKKGGVCFQLSTSVAPGETRATFGDFYLFVLPVWHNSPWQRRMKTKKNVFVSGQSET